MHHGLEFRKVNLSVFILIKLFVQDLDMVHGEGLVGKILNGILDFGAIQVACIVSFDPCR